MTISRALWLWMAIWIGCLTFGSDQLYSADRSPDARAAMRKRSYPWYDANRDALKPLHPARESVPWDLNFSLPFAQILMWVLMGVVVALLLMGLIQWIRNNYLPIERNDGRIDNTEISLERLEALPESARGVGDLLGEAMRLAAQGAYGQAMVFYHSWQLVELDKQQVLELQKGKTNRRYLNEISQSRPELNNLAKFSTRLFEDAFFGNLNVSREDFDQAFNQRSSFEARSGRPRT